MKAIILFFNVAQCYYLNLDMNAVPFLKGSDGVVIDWSSGYVSVLTDTSLATRISARGIHFFNHEVFPTGTAQPCRRSPIALCKTENGSYLFPDNMLPRYAPGTKHCGQSSSNRLIISDDTIYDISACDLFSGYLDVIYWRGNVHFDYDLYLPEWAYIMVAGSVLYLVISLGQNIARIMGDKEAVTMPWFTEFVCLFLVVLIVSLHNPYRVFVASHDRDILWFILVYIIFYLCRHATDLFMNDAYVYTFNIIIATLMLITGRLYCSFENPYCTIYFLLLCTRWFHKLYVQGSAVIKFSIVLDSILIALHYKYCFVASFWDPNFAKIYTIAILMASYMIGYYTSVKSNL